MRISAPFAVLGLSVALALPAFASAHTPTAVKRASDRDQAGRDIERTRPARSPRPRTPVHGARPTQASVPPAETPSPVVSPVSPAPLVAPDEDASAREFLMRAAGLLATRRVTHGTFQGALPSVGTEPGPSGVPVASIVWRDRPGAQRARREISLVSRTRDRLVLQTRSLSGRECSLVSDWAPKQSSILTVLVDFTGTCGGRQWRFDDYPVATPTTRYGRRL